MAGLIILDASVLIAYLDSSDAHYARAIDLILNSHEALAVNEITWAEVLVGAVKDGIEPIVSKTVLIDMGVEVIIPVTEDWPLFLAKVRAATGLKLPDALVLATAKLLDAKVATFDDHLAKIASEQKILFHERITVGIIDDSAYFGELKTQ